MQQQEEISIEKDFVIVTGLWNILQEEDIDLKSVEKYIKLLINSNIYFYYDDEKIREKVTEFNNSKNEEFRNNITFIKLNIEELPTYTMCENHINTIINKYPDILEEIKGYDDLDKSKFNLNSYLGKDINNSSNFTELINDKKDLYVKIVTVLTSKLLLLQDVITKQNLNILVGLKL